MQKGAFQITLLLAVVLTWLPTPGQADNTRASRTLWVDSANIDLTDYDIQNQIISQPVGRLIVTSFEGAKTLYPTTSQLFSQMPQYVGKPDVLEQLIRREHAHGVSVFAYVDCLHWRKLGLFSNDDIFSAHPDLEDLNQSGGCGAIASGKYACIFNPSVEQSLVQLITDLRSRYAGLDGLVLQCRLAPHAPLGYSADTRYQYILDKQTDPIDISFDETTDGFQSARDFEAWRTTKMEDLIRALCSAWRGKNGTGTVATTGYVDWDQLYWTQKCSTLEDWPKWYKDKLVDQVFADLPYDSATFANPPDDPSRDTDGSGQPVAAVNVLLPLSNETGALDPLTELETVETVPISGVTLVVSRVGDLAVASKFWSKILPVIEPALQISKD